MTRPGNGAAPEATGASATDSSTRQDPTTAYPRAAAVADRGIYIRRDLAEALAGAAQERVAELRGALSPVAGTWAGDHLGARWSYSRAKERLADAELPARTRESATNLPQRATQKRRGLQQRAPTCNNLLRAAARGELRVMRVGGARDGNRVVVARDDLARLLGAWVGA